MGIEIIKGIRGDSDRRGLVSVEYECLATDMTEAAALSQAATPMPIDVGLPEVGRTIQEHITNRDFKVRVRFEGLPGDAEPQENQDQFLVDKEYREEPIEAFPYRSVLERDYGAYIDDDGRLKFPEFLAAPKGSGGGTGLGGGAKQDTRNPLFGVTTYPVRYFIATHSFVRTTPPSSFFSDDGSVIKQLPSGFKNPPPGPWIVDKGGTRARGNCVECIARYKQLPKELRHLETIALLLRT